MNRFAEMDSLAFRDGNYLQRSAITIGLDDLGFERGFGVFDYCRVRKGRITFLNDHLRRLDHSQSLLQFPAPVPMAAVSAILEKLLQANDPADAYFKIIISGRQAGDHLEPILTVYQDNFFPYDPALYANGIALILEEYAKPFPAYKTTFYLGSFRVFQRMKENTAEDVLMYADDAIRECARCNIFIVKNGLIYTPDKNMLKGVTRKHVIAAAKEDRIVIEKDISVKELLSADEIFITSTTKNIMPVVRIEDQTIGSGKPGPVTNDLMKKFEKYCTEYDDTGNT